MPLTDEQKNEIQQEVSRALEMLRSASDSHTTLESWLFSAGREHVQRSLPVESETVIGESLDARLRREFKFMLRSLVGARAMEYGHPVGLQTEQVEPLVRAIARAIEVLGTSEKALRWINAPVRSLGGQTPVSLLSSAEGIERVEDALGSIEHGVW